MSRLLVTAIVPIVMCAACAADAPDTAGRNGPLTVYTVNYPLQYFAQRIGGEHIALTFPAPRDGDPAFWKPDLAAIARYQQADLILLNGAGYAKWVDKVSLPVSRLVDTSAAVRERYLRIEGALTHGHGPDGAHAHEGTAFTTWLDLGIAVEQARAVKAALVRAAPQHAGEFEAGFEALAKDLQRVERLTSVAVGAQPGRAVVVSHPVYQYLAQRYHLNLKSVHWEPDVLPGAEAWAELKQLLADHPARWMIWEEEPLAETVAQLQALGVHSVVVDPCGNASEQGDFLDVMKKNLAALRRVYAP
ncbi:MAG: metal ABC transporter substrate-binding protein [Planctomycetota bacterium]|nr:metal ABC transporter substrate-binding protein [Planctomycetota bacterium]